MNTPSSPAPATIPPAPRTGFAHRAAKASWVSVAIVFVLGVFSEATQIAAAKLLVELIALLLMLAGLALGIAALFGIRQHGTRGILGPAIVGIILNGLLIFIFTTNFFAARARAQEHTRGAAQNVQSPN